MQIGEIIRKYRKKIGLTQEQMSERLGVSAPAVNKWENGISYPDITLLAPIARLLNIKLEELLSFKEDLTVDEINQKCEKLVKLLSEGYDAAFQYAVDEIKVYPNCDKLCLSFCKILQAYLVITVSDQDNNKEKYQKQILDYYKRLSDSEEPSIASSANASLSTQSMQDKDYEQAQSYLDRIPKAGFDKRLMQAMLYKREGKIQKAYEEYEKYLYSEYMNFSMTLQLLITMYCDQGELEKGKEIALMGESVAETLGLGAHQSITPILTYAGAAKDKELTITSLEKLIETIDQIAAFKESILFAHFSRINKENVNYDSFIERYKMILSKAFAKESDLDYIKDDERFMKLMEKLK